MAKSPDQIVADIDRKQNEEDLDLPRRAGAAVVKGAKAAKDYVVDTVKDMPMVKTVRDMKDRYDASQIPMKKSDGMKKGGKVAGKLATRGYGKAR